MRNAYLVWCHVKVNFGGTRWARLVSTVLVNRLTRKDKVCELLDASIEILHRLALIQLLQVSSIGLRDGDVENYLACGEATTLLRGLRFLLLLRKKLLELLYLLPVPLE